MVLVITPNKIQATAQHIFQFDTYNKRVHLRNFQAQSHINTKKSDAATSLTSHAQQSQLEIAAAGVQLVAVVVPELQAHRRWHARHVIVQRAYIHNKKLHS
jgi:uncharacterized protein (DUF934 family)